MIYLVARKPGEFEEKDINIYDKLKCPQTNEKLNLEEDYYVNKSNTVKYSTYNDIPILIKE